MRTGDIERLTGAFRRAFPDGGAPKVCLAPGRVNLLGEHLDYNLLPVLPVTLNRHVAVAFAPEVHSVVRVAHGRDEYPDGAFINGDTFDPDLAPSWLRYCHAAVHALNGHFGVDHYPGMFAAVDGDVPPAAGLSSSSALTVAFALAYLKILNKTLNRDITRAELAGVCAAAERLNGVPCGGMDQAVSLLGEDKHACKIDFEPLRMERVPLFADASFVVCNTLVRAEKTGNANAGYANGPALCQVIAEMIERQLQEEIDPGLTVGSLAELWYGDLCLTHAETAELFDRVFPRDATSIADVAAKLHLDPETVLARVCNGSDVQVDSLPLKGRARHQRTEFWRVEQGRDALLAEDAAYFGELMVQSHESCATDYGVSCRELDALVAIAMDAGALGARMTGAGFGGSVVCLVEADETETFVKAIRKRYYREFLERDAPRDAVMVVETSPAAGYC